MPYSYEEFNGNGINTDFTFTVPYLAEAHISTLVDNVVDANFTWLSATQIRFATPPPTGIVNVRILRTTPTTPLTNFVDGASLNEADLDRALLQSLYVTEEAADQNALTVSLYTVSDIAPGSPDHGTVWYDTSTARFYIYYTDADSSQWIETGGQFNTEPANAIDVVYTPATGSATNVKTALDALGAPNQLETTIVHDNTTSGLTAVTLKTAIEELAAVPSTEAAIVHDNATSGLTAVTLKTAIEELAATPSTPMTTQGDVMYGGASGANTRLAAGAAFTSLQMDAAGTTPEWSRDVHRQIANPTAVSEVVFTPSIVDGFYRITYRLKKSVDSSCSLYTSDDAGVNYNDGAGEWTFSSQWSSTTSGGAGASFGVSTGAWMSVHCSGGAGAGENESGILILNVFNGRVTVSQNSGGFLTDGSTFTGAAHQWSVINATGCNRIKIKPNFGTLSGTILLEEIPLS